MNDKLLVRSVAERMFSWQSSIVDKLLADSSLSSVHIIERQLAELSTRWTELQEKYDSYTVEFITDGIKYILTTH